MTNDGLRFMGCGRRSEIDPRGEDGMVSEVVRINKNTDSAFIDGPRRCRAFSRTLPQVSGAD
jgi:hypothetical protein